MGKISDSINSSFGYSFIPVQGESRKDATIRKLICSIPGVSIIYLCLDKTYYEPKKSLYVRVVLSHLPPVLLPVDIAVTAGFLVKAAIDAIKAKKAQAAQG